MLEKNVPPRPTIPKSATRRLDKAEALDVLTATCDLVAKDALTRAEADEVIVNLKSVILFLRAWYRFMG